MNYIILDMEWNQPLCAKMTVTEPFALHGEIVQIGAVKLDGEFNVIDTFNVLITPKYYKKMNRKVQKLTKITTEELQYGLPFTEAFDFFDKWCGRRFALLTWGPDDIPMLRDNLILHGLDTDWIPHTYNLQIIFDTQITKEHRQVALDRALEALGEVGADAHNALNDAMNTALVCRHLNMSEGIENYAQYETEFLTPRALENDSSLKAYRSKREALKDAELVEFTCSECRGRVKCTEFVRQNAGKTLALARCENGEEFLVRFKFIRLADKTIRVKRAVYEMNDENRAFYEKRKEIASSLKKKRVAV
ncbi:MAG: exonuclease domain-containing protein [Clostridia bacterium]|nr:exonuclease domain-containing protein [Clostridia bacterium]